MSKQNRKRENQGEGCRRHLCQFLASSAPSDFSTVHTIASTSSLRPLVSTLRERDGRPPRPASGRYHRHHIATTSPPIDQQQVSASTVFHHARLVPVLFPPSGGEGRAEQTSKRKKRENQGKGCRRHGH